MTLETIRCICGKIVCQIDNVPELRPGVEEPDGKSGGTTIVILCRRCKRYVTLKVPAITRIDYHSKSDLQPSLLSPGM